MEIIQRVSKEALEEGALTNFPFVDEETEPMEPKEERRQVFNPRFRRWEWSDTGEPVDQRRQKPETSTMFMGFGKHHDKRVEEVPTGYLKWALKDCSFLSRELRQAMEAELEDRERTGF
jgi:hypothetical protein